MNTALTTSIRQAIDSYIAGKNDPNVKKLSDRAMSASDIADDGIKNGLPGEEGDIAETSPTVNEKKPAPDEEAKLDESAATAAYNNVGNQFGFKDRLLAKNDNDKVKAGQWLADYGCPNGKVDGLVKDSKGKEAILSGSDFDRLNCALDGSTKPNPKYNYVDESAAMAAYNNVGNQFGFKDRLLAKNGNDKIKASQWLANYGCPDGKVEGLVKDSKGKEAIQLGSNFDRLNCALDGSTKQNPKYNYVDEDGGEGSKTRAARAYSMDILAKYKGAIDSASAESFKEDGNFNIRDIYNLTKSSTPAPQDLKVAAMYVAGDEGLLRDIDGKLTTYEKGEPVNGKPVAEGGILTHVDDNLATNKSGESDGNFTWDDFTKAQEHAHDPNYHFTGYDNGAKKPQDAGTITNFSQAGTGNCGFLATIKSFSLTDVGSKLLKDSIKENDDGSYTVVFRGDPTHQPIIVPPGDYSAFSKGEKDVQILNAAADQYFRDGGDRTPGKRNGVEGQSPDRLFKLLTGNPGVIISHAADPKKIKQFLIDAAPHVGKDWAIAAVGHAGHDGNVSWGGGVDHGVTISKIDVDNGTVTYLNPWDPTQEHTVSIDEMVDQMGNSDSNSGLFMLPFPESRPVS